MTTLPEKDLTVEFPRQRRWAVVGVSDNREKFGNKIYRDLKEAGYDVYGVNPKLETIEGDTCYASLKDLPVKPDVVNVVVPPQVGPAVVAECLELGLKRIWFQPGAESEAAVAQARAGGMDVVHDACIMIQKQQWV